MKRNIYCYLAANHMNKNTIMKMSRKRSTITTK